MEYQQLLNLFDEKYINIDETSFIFKDDPATRAITILG